MTSLFPRIRTGTAYGPGAILPVPLYGLQIFERKAGWDSTRHARRAMGSALRLRRSLIHYRARSNLHRLQKANRRNGKHGPQLLSGEPGWDSAHAAENAALWRFLNAASNPHRLQKAKNKGHRKDGLCFWRRRWDSNPRNITVQLISSQPRYDHFDTSPGRG